MNRAMAGFLLVLSVGGWAAAQPAPAGWVDNREGCWCGALPIDFGPMLFSVRGAGDQPAFRYAVADMLNTWNRHASVFYPVVETTPNLLGAPMNSVNEINAPITRAEALAVYGFDLGGDYGYTWISPDASGGVFDDCQNFTPAGCGFFNEVDILINADFPDGWTADWFDDGGPTSGPALVQATAAHESGHAMGLHHVFTLPAFGSSFSVMNYMNDDAGKNVTRMDAKTIRVEYSDLSNHVSEVGIFPFSYGNDQYSQTYTALDRTAVYGGGVVNASPYTVANYPDQTAINVIVKFYMWSSGTGRRYPDPGDVLLAQQEFGDLPPDTEFASAIGLLVPAVTPGDYWIGAIATVAGAEDLGWDPGRPNNNRFVIGHDEPATLRVLPTPPEQPSPRPRLPRVWPPGPWPGIYPIFSPLGMRVFYMFRIWDGEPVRRPPRARPPPQ